jgi:hypothetical protein
VKVWTVGIGGGGATARTTDGQSTTTTAGVGDCTSVSLFPVSYFRMVPHVGAKVQRYDGAIERHTEGAEHGTPTKSRDFIACMRITSERHNIGYGLQWTWRKRKTTNLLFS